MYADLHLHSKFSDGSDTTPELVEKLLAQNITTFALTDHDTVAGLPSLIEAVNGRAHVITGVEFSCKENGKNTHILGFGFTPDSPEIIEMLTYGQNLRRKNLEIRLSHLKKHGIEFSEEENAFLHEKNSPSRAHLAALLIKNGHAISYQDCMEKYLNGCKRDELRLTAKDAISAIIAAGAIPVWAHPLGGEGEPHEFIPETLEALLSYGLRGMECYYSRYTKEESDFLLSIANTHNLAISGGSDYHGTNKTVKLGELSADGIAIPTENLTVLSLL
jgi:predicted metal-dependent phosphoesterase TrpH